MCLKNKDLAGGAATTGVHSSRYCPNSDSALQLFRNANVVAECGTGKMLIAQFGDFSSQDSIRLPSTFPR